jgi:uncharacterized membrane protein (UPF0127 family)
MAWLLRDGEVLASVEIAESLGARARGLLGRSTLEGAMVLRPARSVHSIGMRFAIDVAFCDDALIVLDTQTLKRNRMTRPRWRAFCVVEARAGAFERWRLRPGDQLELRA